MTSLTLKDHDRQLNSDAGSPSPDSDDFHSSPVRRSMRVKVEWYPMLGVKENHPDRLPNKTAPNANTVFRICTVTRET